MRWGLVPSASNLKSEGEYSIYQHWKADSLDPNAGWCIYLRKVEIAFNSACLQIFSILNFLVQPGSLLGISSIKTSRSGAGGGTGNRLLFLGRTLLGHLLLSEASCLHAA